MPRVLILLPIAMALACGGDDTSPIDNQQDARGDAKNACGGERPLSFLGRPAAPGDPCGACPAGALVCATPDVLVCVGSTDASCPDGGATNLCGGRGTLTLDGMPATPGQPCGPCRDGVTSCAALDIVACIGGRSAGACPDATVSDAGRDSASTDAGVDSAIDGASSDAGSVDAAIDGTSSDTGPVDSAIDGNASDATGVDTSRDTASADTATADGSIDQGSSDAGSDVGLGAFNACGGRGPLYWRGVPTDLSMRCGSCSAQLKCATPTQLVCSPQISCAVTEPNESCDIPMSAYTAPRPTLPAPPAETAPASTTATALTLAANWLVYNPFDFRLYASVASQQGAGGNSVAVIDPYNATIVKTIFVGSEPKAMALSDDGTTLWVALDGAGTVRKIDVISGTAGTQFGVGSNDFSGLWYADRLAVLPGRPGSVAVSRYSKLSTAAEGPIVYDDGVPRPYAAGGASFLANVLIPTYSPQLLFAFNDLSTGNELSTACLNANGLFVKEGSRIFTGFGLSFSFADNVIYASTGVAYEIATGNILGTFAGRGPVAVDAPKRRAYVVAAATTTVTASAYDMDQFLPRGSETVPLSIPSAATLANLVRWGRYGYAFRVNSESIVIARSALVAATP